MNNKILKVVNEASEWTNIKGITSVGIGEKDGKECIIVTISLPISQLSISFPEELEGFPVVIIEDPEEPRIH